MARAKSAVQIAQEIIALCQRPDAPCELASVVEILQAWDAAKARDLNSWVQMWLGDVSANIQLSDRKVQRIRALLEKELHPENLN